MGIPKGITEFKFTEALPIAAAASADRNGAILDMMGYRGVLMCVKSATYIQYGARNRPTTPTVTDKVTYERHESPAEGTA